MLTRIKRILTVMLAVCILVMSIGIAPVSAKTVFDEPVLLSEGKTATATAHSNSFPENLAFDGNTATRWYAGDGAKYPQTITVDLEKAYNLAYVDTYWFNMTNTGGGRVFGYRVLTSVDGTEYTLIADETDLTSYSNAGTGINNMPRQRDNLYTTARYVRLEVTGCNQGNPASAWEIQVYGYDTALKFDGNGISATSEEPDYEAALAADGDPETAWKASEDGEQSWTIDLEAGYSLDGIDISWLDDTADYNYDIQTSLDGVSFTAADENSFDAYARYVRINIHNCSVPDAVGIREVGIHAQMSKLDAVIDLGDSDVGFDPEKELILEFTNSLEPDTDLLSHMKFSKNGEELDFDITELTEGKIYRIEADLEYGQEYMLTLFSLNDVFGQQLLKEISFKTLLKKELSEIEFYTGGSKIESLTAGTITAKMTARNNQGETFSPCLILIVFNKAGSVLDIAADEAELTVGNGRELEVSVNVTDAENSYVKAYVWDGLNRMSELTAPVVLR